MLVMILNLYFQLTPITMVEETPEIQQLAKKMKIKPSVVVEVMDIYQIFDPYLKREEMIFSSLLGPCQKVTDSRTKAGTETETHTTADVASEVAGDAFG